MHNTFNDYDFYIIAFARAFEQLTPHFKGLNIALACLVTSALRLVVVIFIIVLYIVCAGVPFLRSHPERDFMSALPVAK